ncbi:hypothetical protein GQ44DRAFT_718076 [Phaeosphaeriaceae sp. PMI808]|nr:hypothetical protein GQ44DRAFT_718076 [Phaeosphaeriaceae sp. PMI808]
MGYGTAAVRWHNGTTQPIAQISGSSAYLQLMKQLSSTTPESRFPSDIPTTAGKVQYVLDYLRRLMNKSFGRPTNLKAAILAEMLAQLKTSVEQVLSSTTPVTHAIVTSPDGICLTNWEMNDVLDFIHIKNLMEDPDSLYSISAAFAGNGYGLCKEYTNVYRCEVEGHVDFLNENVLNVDFSDQALRLTTKSMRTYKALSISKAVIDTKLGYIEGLDEQEIEDMFQRIGDKIRSFVQSQQRKLAMILLTGTRVGERRFKEAIRNALEDTVAAQAITVFDRNLSKDVYTVFATAKGAAEVAKRRLEAPVRCRWKEDCEALKTGKHKEGGEENIEL